MSANPPTQVTNEMTKPPPLTQARSINQSLRDTHPDRFTGTFRCRSASCTLCDLCPIPCHIKFLNTPCCLWGIWCCCYVPVPALSCVTYCLCKEGSAYITQKGGVKTGELVAIDDKGPNLAMYPANGLNSVGEEAQCWCERV